MSDMGDDFKALKEIKRAKKQSNLERSTTLLNAKGIEFESKNNGIHLIVRHGEQVFDFYPSTGLFINRVDKKQGRGVFQFIKLLGVNL